MRGQFDKNGDRVTWFDPEIFDEDFLRENNPGQLEDWTAKEDDEWRDREEH